MKTRTFLTLLITVLAVLCLSSVTLFAAAIQRGTPTPKSLITAELFPTGSAAAVGNCSFLNVREGPGNGYRAFTYLAKGDAIVVQGYDQKWVRLDTDKGTGWVYAGYVLNDAVRAAAAGVSASSAGSAASLGRPTPVGLITPDMFPVGKQTRVDYCYFLNVRRGPDRSYAAFTTLARGDAVTVLEYDQKWVLVSTDEGDGWIYTGYLTHDSAAAGFVSAAASGGSSAMGRPTPVDALNADMFPISGQETVDYCYFLNVRRGPARSYGAFTYLARGDAVTVLDYDQKWILVETPKGDGWIYTGYLLRN